MATGNALEIVALKVVHAPPESAPEADRAMWWTSCREAVLATGIDTAILVILCDAKREWEVGEHHPPARAGMAP